MRKKFKIFLIVSIACSLICGIVTTINYFQYLSSFSNVFWSCSNEMSCILENSNFNPDLWVIIPILFAVGFFVPLIAYVFMRVEDAVDDIISPLK